MIRYPLFLLILTIFLTITCHKDTNVFPAPVLSTLPAREIDSTGVTFSAKIIKKTNEKIVAHGFIWYTSPIFSINQEPELFEHILIKDAPRDTFSARANIGLNEGQVYYVRAFVRSEKWTVYGDPVFFQSQGSLVPKILAVLPDSLFIGDTITILGENFLGPPDQLIVKVNDKPIPIIYSSEKEIRCVLRLCALQGSKLTVFINQIIPSNVYLLSYKKFTITDYQPKVVAEGDTITLTGSGFFHQRSPIDVIIETPIDPIPWVRTFSPSPGKLQFVVPTFKYYSESYPFSLRDSCGNRIDNLSFEIAGPEIKGFYPAEGTLGDTITLFGNFFSSPGYNKVFHGNPGRYDLPWESIMTQPGQLKVKINRQLTLNNETERTAPLFVQLGSKTAQSETMFKYVNKEWKIQDILPDNGIASPHGFSNENEIFISNVKDGSWWKYHVATKKWARIASLPNDATTDLPYIFIPQSNNEGYIGKWQFGSTPRTYVWKYDPESDKWSQIPAFQSNGQTLKPALLTFEDNLFLCLGGWDPSFWKLNTTTGNWESAKSFDHLLSSHPGVPDIRSVAISGSIGYVLIANNNQLFILSYDHATDRWDLLLNIPFIWRNTHPAIAIVDQKMYFPVINDYSKSMQMACFNLNTRGFQLFDLNIPPIEDEGLGWQCYYINNNLFFTIGKYVLEWIPRQ